MAASETKPARSSAFEQFLEPVWIGVGSCRQRHSRNRLIVWIRLSENESTDGDLFGVRIYEKGLLGKREYGQLLMAYKDGYVIRAWKKRRQLVDIFRPKQSGDITKERDIVIEEFTRLTDQLANAALAGTLKEAFPADWIGDSPWELLR